MGCGSSAIETKPNENKSSTITTSNDKNHDRKTHEDHSKITEKTFEENEIIGKNIPKVTYFLNQLLIDYGTTNDKKNNIEDSKDNLENEANSRRKPEENEAPEASGRGKDRNKKGKKWRVNEKDDLIYENIQ